jgi:hypothetical protein
MEMAYDLNQKAQAFLHSNMMYFDRAQIAPGIGKEPKIQDIMDALVNPSGFRETEIYLENKMNMAAQSAGEALLDMTLEQIIAPDIYNETTKTAKAREKIKAGRK